MERGWGRSTPSTQSAEEAKEFRSYFGSKMSKYLESKKKENAENKEKEEKKERRHMGKAERRRRRELGLDEEMGEDEDLYGEDKYEQPLPSHMHLRKFFTNYSWEERGDIPTRFDFRRARFLLIAVQTFGDLPCKKVIPAEMCIVEFSVLSGILNEYHAIVGPMRMSKDWYCWGDTELSSEDMERAEKNAQITHQLPISLEPAVISELQKYHTYTNNWAKLILNLLVRTEPMIADGRKGTKGLELYKKGYKNHVKEEHSVIQACIDEKRPFPTGLIVPNRDERRWILCSPSQETLIRESISFLDKGVSDCQYEGLPVERDRYILLNIWTDTLGSIIGHTFDFKVFERLSNFNEKCFAWNADICCSYHTDKVTSHCAQALARKTCQLFIDSTKEALMDK